MPLWPWTGYDVSKCEDLSIVAKLHQERGGKWRWWVNTKKADDPKSRHWLYDCWGYSTGHKEIVIVETAYNSKGQLLPDSVAVYTREE